MFSKVHKLSCNVSDVFPKVLEFSSEMSECKPLGGGRHDQRVRGVQWQGGAG